MVPTSISKKKRNLTTSQHTGINSSTAVRYVQRHARPTHHDHRWQLLSLIITCKNGVHKCITRFDSCVERIVYLFLDNHSQLLSKKKRNLTTSKHTGINFIYGGSVRSTARKT